MFLQGQASNNHNFCSILSVCFMRNSRFVPSNKVLEADGHTLHVYCNNYNNVYMINSISNNSESNFRDLMTMTKKRPQMSQHGIFFTLSTQKNNILRVKSVYIQTM